jgi:hypothetical protein
MTIIWILWKDEAIAREFEALTTNCDTQISEPLRS